MLLKLKSFVLSRHYRFVYQTLKPFGWYRSNLCSYVFLTCILYWKWPERSPSHSSLRLAPLSQNTDHGHGYRPSQMIKWEEKPRRTNWERYLTIWMKRTLSDRLITSSWLDSVVTGDEKRVLYAKIVHHQETSSERQMMFSIWWDMYDGSSTHHITVTTTVQCK